jgi:LacI family transcriptional regulator
MSQTLRDIAAKANVSVSTASRALNGHAAIGAETIARVRQIAETLQYQHRRSHGRPDSKRYLSSTKIGLLTLGMERSLTALPTVALAIAGAEEALADAEANIHFAHIPNPQIPQSSLLKQRLRGAIVTGALQGALLAQASPELLEWLRGMPLVWMLGRPVGGWGDTVGTDDFELGRMAAECLFNHGHRRLAIINSRPDQLLFRRREDGFIAAAHRLSAKVRSFCEPEEANTSLPLSAPKGFDTIQRLVDALVDSKDRPTAIFAVADSIAALVYRALAVRNLRVGREISVISGNNDAALIAALHPHLTTFDAHAREVGHLAVRQLTTRMFYPGEFAETDSLVAPTLVAGDSIACLKS